MMSVKPMHNFSDLPVNVEIRGLDLNDPCSIPHAYIAYAEHVNGSPMTPEEIEQISEDDFNQLVYLAFTGAFVVEN